MNQAIINNKFGRIAAALILAGMAGTVQTAPLSIVETPLFLVGNVEPNIMLMIDNSGSMTNIVPDAPYNPATTYLASCPVASIMPGGATSLATLNNSETFDVNVSAAGAVTLIKSGSGSGTYTYGTGAGRRCFNPSLLYNARLYANGTSAPYVPAGGYLDAVYTGNYLNWYLGTSASSYANPATFPTSGADRGRKSGTRSRLEVVRTSASNLVDSLGSEYRVGFSAYNGSTGGRLIETVDTLTPAKKTLLKNDINALTASGSTPLAETLSSIGRYFSTGSSGSLTVHPDGPGTTTETPANLFHDIQNCTSAPITAANQCPGASAYAAPIQYFCQKSFAVLLTDGRPTNDRDIHALLRDYSGDCAAGLCDATSNGTTLPGGPMTNTPGGDCPTNRHFLACDNGTKVGRRYEGSGSDYLDDVALGLQDMDLRPDLSKPSGSTISDKNNVVTYMIGFADEEVKDDPLVKDTASRGGGEFKLASNSAELISAFDAIAATIAASSASSSALAANSTSIQTTALLYQARFDSRDWSGSLSAYQVKDDGSPGIEYWNAAKITTNTNTKGGVRNIFTLNGGIKQKLSVGVAPTNALLAALDNGVADADAGEKDTLDWILGSHSKEKDKGGTLRKRERTLADLSKEEWVLGDIVNSDPNYEKDEDYGYSTLPSGTPGQSSYAGFVAGKASRAAVLYVGANDGMLHAFEASTGSDSGKEIFAHIPYGVYGKLKGLTSDSFTHKYLVDGPPQVGDAYLGLSTGSTGWNTILVSGLGGGGKSVFALDVTSPTTFTKDQIMWEFTETDLGLTYSQPQIALVDISGTKTWVAIFGNGYNSTNENAFLYVVDLATGSQLAKLSAGGGPGNGLSTPVLHDADGDKIIDAVYAGDLQGDMWKFDLKSAWAASKLFDGDSTKPITAQPQIYMHGSHPLVLFGTGQYLTSGDIANSDTQTFYAVQDLGDGSVVTSGNLVSQTIDKQEQVTVTQSNGSSATFDLRLTSANTVDYAVNRGWKMDLVVSGMSPSGERVVSTALIKHGRVIFVTVDPSATKCEPGGESWLMELDVVTGGRTTDTVFDFNNDNQFDSSDNVIDSQPVSGVKSTVGITKTPIWIDGKDPGVGFKEMSGSTGGIMPLKNKGGSPPPGPPGGGGGAPFTRIYWMQIQ